MKYDEQVVLSFIDHPRVQYKGAPITEENLRAFLGDGEVPEEDRTRSKAQYGERADAEYLHEKNEAKSKLFIVDDDTPNTSNQVEKLRGAASAGPVRPRRPPWLRG